MTTINQTAANQVVQDLALKKVEKTDELDKNAFLQLMVAQLNNQDPLSPQDNGEFIAQLAQFSSVEGIDNLNNSFESLSSTMQSSQALQASALVGRTVHVDSDESLLESGEVITGNIKLEASTSNLTLSISNAAGELVDQIPLGQQQAGEIKFAWNGLTQNQVSLPPGKYTFKAEAMVDGAAEQQKMALSANVDSVTIKPDRSVVLNLAGLGAVALLDVEEIL